MIFGRKKKTADEVDEAADLDPTTDPAGDGERVDDAESDDLSAASPQSADEGDDGGEGDEDQEDGDDDSDADDSETDDDDRWSAFDLSRDWREEGPFDISEVDLEADEVERLDFGSLIVTPMPECEIRLQVTEETEQIIAALLVKDESALELSAYAAPRTPGMWAEIREEIIDGTQSAGGTADCIEGPFGTELVRNLPVQNPDGQLVFQPSRTWVAEGPRWLLRGVLFGQAALTDEFDDDVVGPFFDAFCDVIVRRGETAMPVGDVLPLTLPPELQAASEEAQQAAEG